MADNISLILQTMIDSSKLKSEQLPKLIAQVKEQYKLRFDVELDDKTAKKYANQIFKARDGLKEIDKITFTNQIQAWRRVNSAAEKEFGGTLDDLLIKLKEIDNKVDFNNLQKRFRGVKAEAGALGITGKSIGDTFTSSARKFAEWTVSAGAVMMVVQSLRQMKDEVFNLDAVITDLAMATGKHGKELQGLISDYSKLGDQLSATVTDVTASATEWLKQGKAISDTNELVKDAIVLSKISGLSAAEGTKYLTSAMKGYQVSVADTIGIVDKLSAVDMASATDVGGLAEGMSQVAASADLAGVSMDKLLGYLAVVGETTQEGMSSVGTSFNAIFSRMGNIKLSRLKDYQNSGDDLSNVETVLRGENILLRDSEKSFRDFGDVLDEVAGRWTGFSEVSQRAIASAFAGTHHMNDFIILMENYSTALQYTETSLNSSGEAMDKFSAYQDSLAGHTEKFRNAFIGLSNTVIDSNLLSYLIDLGTIGVKGIDGLVNALGSLGTIGAIGGGILGAKGLGQRNRCRYNWLRGSRSRYCYG